MQIPRFASDRRLAVLAALLLVLCWPRMSYAMLSPYTCMIVQPPPPPTNSNNTPPPGGTPHITSVSPEPASMVSGLLGSGIAGLFVCLRKRRARRRAQLQDEWINESEAAQEVELSAAA